MAAWSVITNLNLSAVQVARSLIACTLFLAQSLAAADANWEVLKTEYGYPDLQGNWTNPYQTPLRRPAGLGTKRAYTEQEAAVLVERALALDVARTAPLDPNRAAPASGGLINQQADGNFEIMPTEIARVNGEFRTSLIIDPDDGQMPLLPNATDIFDRWRAQGFGNFDGPEIRTPLDRCLNPGAQLPLLIIFGGPGGGNPAGDNPVRNIQIVQNRDYVVILSEYFSLVRIIRLNSEHLSRQGNKWMGDSIGHYAGNSLIIHTDNFRPEQSTTFIKSSNQLEITETITVTAKDELLYSYTLSDPQIYRQPFTAEIPLRRMPPEHRLYEYACHEGNYSMTSMLRAARMEEINR